jgi:succinate dehydrogenase/fumarate reductase-like Fe-S protein
MTTEHDTIPHPQDTGVMPRFVTVEVMGKKHRVPEGITVIQALWYTGHEMIRGIGCLGGTCGACAMVYRMPGRFELLNGLGCQQTVRDGMWFSMVSDYPAAQAHYRVSELTNAKEQLFELYPESARCVNCNACNRVCPQGIDVRSSIWYAVFGDFQKVADLTMSCNMCGLCITRCVADMPPNLIGLYARRAQGALYAPPADDLGRRIADIAEGKFRDDLDQLLSLDASELKSRAAAVGR